MNTCMPEIWSLRQISDALSQETIGNKKIVIPIFQRGKRWNSIKEEALIDSLKKGYPVGSLLFYKTVSEGKEIYTLIDGLQRGNTIKKYLSLPTHFFKFDDLSDKTIKEIYKILECGNIKDKNKAQELITNYIEGLKTFDDLAEYELANKLSTDFPIIEKKIIDFCKLLNPEFKKLREEYNKLCNVQIPATVYMGDESTLPEIFTRLNSEGVPLTQYEIFAASWPRDEFNIKNANIVDYILKKYDLINDGEYTILGYDREKKRINKNVNAFEYVFGLSKYLQNKYSILYFNTKMKDDEANPLGFELLNACFNSSHAQIKEVYKIILRFKNDISYLEEKLFDAIEFVKTIISPITKFKGNNRSDKITPFHSQFQILALISFVFRKKYNINSNLEINSTWNEDEIILKKTIKQYYVYDIITTYWFQGGTNIIHYDNASDRYLQELSINQFSTAYDSYSENLFARKEKETVLNPSKKEFVILNSIYLSKFTALDQLSDYHYDVEHLATKEQMKKLIKYTSYDSRCGLPISHIANLCYLPEFSNRSKGEKTLYQDDAYLIKSNITLDEIENKFSFTTKEDLEFLNNQYKENDFDKLAQDYIDYLKKRNKVIKTKLLEALGYDSENLTDNGEEFEINLYKEKKIGLLARTLIQEIVDKNKLSLNEIEDLFSIEESNRIFGLNTPMFSLDLYANMGKGNKVRYYASPISEFKGRPLYLTSEWYEESRFRLVKWYNSYMNNKDA